MKLKFELLAFATCMVVALGGEYRFRALVGEWLVAAVASHGHGGSGDRAGSGQCKDLGALGPPIVGT
jgi:hypothetical protein